LQRPNGLRHGGGRKSVKYFLASAFDFLAARLARALRTASPAGDAAVMNSFRNELPPLAAPVDPA
jgi:hypothetical protein